MSQKTYIYYFKTDTFPLKKPFLPTMHYFDQKLIDILCRNVHNKIAQQISMPVYIICFVNRRGRLKDGN